ncbi:MAG: hypothetical protein ACRD4C_03090 [Candidatus Acidiferrales bacterium]
MTTDASSDEGDRAEPNQPETKLPIFTSPYRMGPALRTGIYIGAFLNLVMIAALVAANRFPNLDSYALERNAASFGLFFILFLFPVIRFMNRPLRIFVAGIVGWVLFVAGYDTAGLYFHNLFQVLRTPLEMLFEGTVVYGIAAAVIWVIRMALHARHNPIAPRRRSVHHVAGYNR